MGCNGIAEGGRLRRERQLGINRLDFLQLLGIRLGQPLAQQPIEAGIKPAVQAGVGAGDKAAAALVATASAGIELADAPVDRPGNRRVIANLEMGFSCSTSLPQ